MEDHITIIKDPELIYLGHFTATSDTGQQIVIKTLRFLGSKKFDVIELNGLGCNRTSTNTVSKNSASLEQLFEKYLQ